MKPMTYFVAAAFAATAVFSAPSSAADSKNQGYWIDAHGDIAKSGTGLCWHTSDWTPARAVEGCDPVIRPVAAAPAPAPAIVVAPRAAIVAAAPPPAPKPAPGAIIIVPVKVPPQKLSFSADALFAFDKAVLNPEGKVMLDGLVSQINGASYDNILAIGHTDRLGSDTYNQKLSVRRAEAVKDYLVSKSIPANRITAEGKGESQPMTKAGDCTGGKSAKLIACLQPDRRVDVEMTGTRQSQ